MSLKSKKLFVDGRTDGRTDILRPTVLGRLGGVDLIIKNSILCNKATVKTTTSSFPISCIKRTSLIVIRFFLVFFFYVSWKKPRGTNDTVFNGQMSLNRHRQWTVETQSAHPDQENSPAIIILSSTTAEFLMTEGALMSLRRLCSCYPTPNDRFKLLVNKTRTRHTNTQSVNY